MQATKLKLNNLIHFGKNTPMSSFYKNLEKEVVSAGLSFYKLQFLAGITSSQFSQWKNGKRNPSDTEIEKLASVKELGLDLTTLRKWRAMDEYPEFAELLEYPLDELKAAYELAKKRKETRQ